MFKITCVLLLFSSLVEAQWSLIYSNNLYSFDDINFPSEKIGYCVGNESGKNNIVLKTTDAGKNWNIIFNEQHENGVGLSSVFFIDNNNGWICGRNASVFHTSDGGSNWEEQNSGVNQKYYLNDIFFWDKNYGWIVGGIYDSISLILKTIDGGNNWIKITDFPEKESLQGYFSITFMDSLTGWATGGGYGQIIKTTDGGNSWTEKFSERRALQLSSICYKDGMLCAVGKNSKILSSFDFGETWEEQYVNLNENLYSVSFINADSGYAVGNKGTLIYTENGGTNWFYHHFPGSSNIPNYSFRSISFTENGTGWIATWFGALVSTDHIVSIEEKTDETLPTEFALEQNYPNPFNPTTKIKYTIPYVGDENFSSLKNIKLEIFNILGQKIKTLVNEPKQTGTYEVEFQANNLPSGIYYYRLNSGDYSETKKMVLLQ